MSMVSKMKTENSLGGRKYCGGKMIDMREAWGSKKERKSRIGLLLA